MKYIFGLLFALVLQAAIAQNITTQGITNGSQLPPTPEGAPLTTTPTGANTNYNNAYPSINTGMPANSVVGNSGNVVTPPPANFGMGNGNQAPINGGSSAINSTTNTNSYSAPQNIYNNNNSLNGASLPNLQNSTGATPNTNTLDAGSINSGYGTGYGF